MILYTSTRKHEIAKHIGYGKSSFITFRRWSSDQTVIEMMIWDGNNLADYKINFVQL